jgi:hypothetical protein
VVRGNDTLAATIHHGGSDLWGDIDEIVVMLLVVISCEEEVVLYEVVRMIADNSYSWQQI